ncbi:MAG: hypothetical protein WC443_03495 [Desulfobaccales bacterium]
MPQSMPEVLDYRNLVGKLARIDSEWESLKGLLTFRVPHKNDEPANSPAAYDAGSMDMANNLVEFPGSTSPVKIQPGDEESHSPIPITPRELEAITRKGGKGHDKTLMERLIKVERQIHKLTLLVTAFMTLAIALFAVIAFLGFKDNLVNRSALPQPQELAAASNPPSPEAVVPANDSQLSSAPEIISPSNPQPLSPTDGSVTNDAGKLSETETSPAVPDPAPKFVGSMTSNKAHYPDCRWAARINAKNLVTFPSLAAAQEQGYVPCPVCRPHEADDAR